MIKQLVFLFIALVVMVIYSFGPIYLLGLNLGLIVLVGFFHALGNLEIKVTGDSNGQ